MPSRPNRALRGPAAALSATALTLAGFGLSAGNFDGMVAESFARALRSDRDTPLAAAPRTASAGPADASSGLTQLSGSEDFWLSRTKPKLGTTPVAWSRPFGIGDRITISSEGRETQFEVIEIKPIGGTAGTEQPVVAGTEPLLLVTCREAGAADARSVRFVVESGQGLDGMARLAPRSL